MRIALASRDVIGQAKGILMEGYKIDAVEAFDLLVMASQGMHRKPRNVAGELLGTGDSTLTDTGSPLRSARKHATAHWASLFGAPRDSREGVQADRVGAVGLTILAARDASGRQRLVQAVAVHAAVYPLVGFVLVFGGLALPCQAVLLGLFRTVPRLLGIFVGLVRINHRIAQFRLAENVAK